MTVNEVVAVASRQVDGPTPLVGVLSLLWAGVWTVDMLRPIGGPSVLFCSGPVAA